MNSEDSAAAPSQRLHRPLYGSASPGCSSGRMHGCSPASQTCAQRPPALTAPAPKWFRPPTSLPSQATPTVPPKTCSRTHQETLTSSVTCASMPYSNQRRLKNNKQPNQASSLSDTAASYGAPSHKAQQAASEHGGLRQHIWHRVSRQSDAVWWHRL